MECRTFSVSAGIRSSLYLVKPSFLEDCATLGFCGLGFDWLCGALALVARMAVCLLCSFFMLCLSFTLLLGVATN